MDVREQLERAMAAMEAQRDTLGDAVVDAALAAFREKLAALDGPGENPTGNSGQVGPATNHPVTVLSAEARVLEAGLDAGDLWQRLDAVITRFGGRIEKRDSRGIVAMFGLQAPRPDDAEQAVRAALEIMYEPRQFSNEGVKLQIGINSGSVWLSTSGDTCEYTPLGETIILAIWLQASAGPGDILISQSTFRAVRGIFDIETLAPLIRTGETEPVQVYRVRGVRPRVFRLAAGLAGRPGGTAPLVGRDAELKQLQSAFLAARNERQVRSVSLTGEGGMGKTRLANDFLAWLEQSRQSFILFRGHGDWQLNRLPYALLRGLLSFRFKILESDPADVARDKLQRGVEDWLGKEGIETAHWIGHLAGFEFNQSPYLSGRLDDPRRARQLAFQALNRFVSAVAKHTPLIVLADDLQWADDCSLDWLDALARSSPGGPVLLIGMARPTLFERRPKWDERWPGHTRIHLLPLSDLQAGALGGQLLSQALSQPRLASHEAPTRPRSPGHTGPLGSPQPSGDPLAGVIAGPAQRIVERAGGNPFFIEQMVQAFLEEGVFVPCADRRSEPAWQVDSARLEAATLPGSLIEVLQAQLDELPVSEREVALRAAVVGPVFWEAAVCGLLESAAGSGACLDSAEVDLLRVLDLPGALRALQERGIIFKHETSAFEHTDEYEFKSAMVYQVAYESQLVRWRRQDHARVAIWLAAQSGERVEAYAAVIAGHYERAEERLLAADWYGLAAMQALRSSAPESALRFFNRALELLPEDPGYFPQRVQFFKGVWDVQWWQARYADALATGQTLLAAAEASGDLVVQAAAWNRIAAVQNRQGEYQAALRSLQRAERLARSGGAAREVVMALFNRGVTLYRLGDEAAALEAGERALAFNRSLFGQGGESGQDAGQADVAEPEVELGGEPVSLQAAQADLERVREMARDSLRQEGKGTDETSREAARETARILNLLAMINQRAGRYDQAEKDYRQVLILQRDRGDRAAVLATINSLGIVAQLQGDYRLAVEYFQEGFKMAREMGFQELGLVCLNNLAGAQVELDEYSQAEAGLREVLRRAEHDTSFLFTEVYRSLALACLGQGRRDEALAAGLRALGLARQGRLAEHVGKAWRVLGRVSAAFDPKTEGVPVVVDGREYSTHACYGASVQIFVEMGAASEQARTARELATFELEHGDRREGARLWQEARDLFARLGLGMEVERMDHLSASRIIDPS